MEGLARGWFEHLNRKEDLAKNSEIDWKLGPVSEHRLWVNTLHYHYWAYDLAEASRQGGELGRVALRVLSRLLSDWLSKCDIEKPGARELAWNPYTIATRLAYWISALNLMDKNALEPGLREELIKSAFKQASYLYHHVEWDLRGNHLLRDASGLAWACRFFSGGEANKWMRRARELAVSQAEEQVLPDGGHFERSPMYHVHAMEDVLSLALLLEDKGAADKMRSAWARMADFIKWMRHPDGEVPLFNDGAMNAVCLPGGMLSFSELAGSRLDAELPAGGKLISHSGMAAWHKDPWTVFFDVGPIGPDYQPGHGHADTLTIECSYRGSRLFVDPGTYCYDQDERRLYDRSTRSHNTVCIDGEDSSEVWSIFRAGRRARPVGVQADFSGHGFETSAGHDGYDHLPGRPRHYRRLSLDRDCLCIIDRIEGGRRHRLEGGLLVSPEWKAEETPGGWELNHDGSRVEVLVKGPKGLRLCRERAWYHPEYGLERDTVRLTWSLETTLPVEVQTVVQRVS